MFLKVFIAYKRFFVSGIGVRSDHGSDALIDACSDAREYSSVIRSRR